jgi:hypothetical protein
MFVVSRLPYARHPDLVAVGVLIDMTIVLPAAFFLLFVRRRQSVAGLLPVFLVSLAVAAAILPARYSGPVSRVRFLALPAEFGLIAYLLWRARQTFVRHSNRTSETDILAALQESCSVVFANRRLARMLAYEAGVLYYALFSWFSPPPQRGSSSFSYHRQSGYGVLVAAVTMVAVMEIGGAHFLLQMWSVRAAWALTALELYGMLWIIGDYQAMRLRPLVLQEDAIEVRVGLRWSVRIPYVQIACLRATGKEIPRKRSPGYLHAAVLVDPKLILDLRSPALAAGAYGIEKTITRVGIAVDDAAGLRSALAAKGLSS